MRHRLQVRKRLSRVAEIKRSDLSAPASKRTLGLGGPEISPLGLGCFGLSSAYGRADDSQSIRTIQRALDLGCNLLDTADEYGAGRNELLVGRAVAGRRKEAVIGTKFGFVCDGDGKPVGLNGHPDYVRGACEGSLRRLGTDVIDLYYLHRIDPEIPVEETVGAMAQLAAAGKVRYLGLSEATPEQVRRAFAVHPIAALQSEYSLWTREPEQAILPACRELGITFVAFSPLGRGFFAGKLSPGSIEREDFRTHLPRFSPGNFELNSRRLSGLQTIADQKGCSPGQLALAWVLARGEGTVAIPGTKSVAHLEENLGALYVQLSVEEKRTMDEAFRPGIFAGERYANESVFRPKPQA